jgi:hypothetical protein
MVTHFDFLPLVSEIAGIGYSVKDFPDIILDREAEPDPSPVYPLEDWQFVCPSLVFFYLPDKDTKMYDCVKVLSDLEFGINTQCIVQNKVCEQKRGVDQ